MDRFRQTLPALRRLHAAMYDHPETRALARRVAHKAALQDALVATWEKAGPR